MENNLVETINGQTVNINDCRKFGDSYYLIGNLKEQNSGDCYLINDRYYRIDTGMVIFDHEKQEHVLKNDSLFHGVVSVGENDELIYGAFSENPNSNGIVVLETGSRVRVINTDIFENNRTYRERLSNGKFYHIKSLPASEFNRIAVPPQEYKTSLAYSVNEALLERAMTSYNKLDVEILPNIARYAPVMKGLSFGLEFETVAGMLSPQILNKTGLIPLRDGSIRGIEYVTVPLEGEKGFQVALNAVNQLKLRTKYDETCALHMHIGNVPRTPSFILAFFKLTCALQDEIYTLFPLYKKYNFGIKNKNYSKPYPIYELLSQIDAVIDKTNLNKNFDILYQYLSMGEPFAAVGYDLKNVQSHPADRDGRSKWNIRTRKMLAQL